MPRVSLYTTAFCPFCHQAKGLLEEYEIGYEEVDLGAEPERRAEMVERAGGRVTVPQVFIDGAHVGGCDDLYALADRGGLDAIAESGAVAVDENGAMALDEKGAVAVDEDEA